MTNTERAISVDDLTSGHPELNWLLEDLVARVVGARHAVVLSADGLLLAHSPELSKDDSDHLSAMASAFQSLARGTGRHFGGGQVRQTIVEMERAHLFVTAAGQGACLAVVGDEDADMGMIAYEMNMLVKRVGAYLSSAPRTMASPRMPNPLGLS
ncbi:roadblock/LC7 domain-containing protein [Lentzea albida]|uniref:Predicted regulator of Ras-like GTPase activity, Roadblock/LC7/MglB family n=1 Tax=Lentzea albida TaxID=65499 RepID=A0A1H9PKD5_9PSEU|nr:roadblock/LC7 domain-containing protein [Lentzea albida]SER48681.1 Predicted regulator of Ras-like GTPase activity, Roadblock/LC7/MglB family [Lentzea albida]